MKAITTKKGIFAHFDEKIAQKAIVPNDDEPENGRCYEIQGKYCRITSMPNGLWGIWLCNPKNVAAGLSKRKISALVKRLQDNADYDLGFVVLDGEAYTQKATKEFILDNLKSLGIPKKRQLSEKQKSDLVDRLRTASQEGESAQNAPTGDQPHNLSIPYPLIGISESPSLAKHTPLRDENIPERRCAMSIKSNSEIQRTAPSQEQGGRHRTKCRKCMYGPSDGGWWREIMQECDWTHCPLFSQDPEDKKVACIRIPASPKEGG